VEPRPFDSFPAGIALAGVSVSVAIYVLGAYILSGLGVLACVLYLGYCGFVELSVLRGSCIHCYYYGKVCGLGRGKLCALIFPRGDPQTFIQRKVSFRDILPDLLVPVIPLAGGMLLLVRDFMRVVLLAMLAVLLLGSAGTAIVRGSLACRHCAQRVLGCPAQELFSRQRP
jgi:hypothetical protein